MGVTPLRCYYGPLRLPRPTRQQVIDSPSGGSPCWHRVEAGLPSSRLFVRLVPSPFTPEGSTGALDRCFPADAGFTLSGRLATLSLCNEADLSSLVVTARACDGRGSKLGITPHLARPSSCVTINSHGKLLSVCASSRASWRTRDTEATEKEAEAEIRTRPKVQLPASCASPIIRSRTAAAVLINVLPPSWYTTVRAGTESSSHTLPPMIDPRPMVTSPNIVAPA